MYETQSDTVTEKGLRAFVKGIPFIDKSMTHASPHHVFYTCSVRPNLISN